MEALIRRLWPILRVQVVALLAAKVKKLAAKSKLNITDDDAVVIATLAVELITELLDRDDATDPVLVEKAAAMLASPLSD